MPGWFDLHKGSLPSTFGIIVELNKFTNKFCLQFLPSNDDVVVVVVVDDDK